MSPPESRRGPSEPAPALPVTWRPVRTRRVATTVAVAVLVSAVALAVALPHGGGRPWGLADRLAIVLIGGLVVAVLLMMARPRIVADEHGLTVVNLVNSRRLAWAEVVSVRLADGDPWLVLDLADGDTMVGMGIQASGGEPARRAARELAALVAQRSVAEPGD